MGWGRLEREYLFQTKTFRMGISFFLRYNRVSPLSLLIGAPTSIETYPGITKFNENVGNLASNDFFTEIN